MYVYRLVPHTDPHIFSVGFYDPDGKWHPESDHTDPEKAASRVAYLNGGGKKSNTKKKQTSAYDLNRVGHRLRRIERQLRYKT